MSLLPTFFVSLLLLCGAVPREEKTVELQVTPPTMYVSYEIMQAYEKNEIAMERQDKKEAHPVERKKQQENALSRQQKREKAFSFYEAQRYGEALKLYEEVLREWPQEEKGDQEVRQKARIYERIGIMLFEQKDFEAAFSQYVVAKNLRGSFPDPSREDKIAEAYTHKSLALCAIHLKNYGLALRELQKALVTFEQMGEVGHLPLLKVLIGQTSYEVFLKKSFAKTLRFVDIKQTEGALKEAYQATQEYEVTASSEQEILKRWVDFSFLSVQWRYKHHKAYRKAAQDCVTYHQLYQKKWKDGRDLFAHMDKRLALCIRLLQGNDNR